MTALNNRLSLPNCMWAAVIVVLFARSGVTRAQSPVVFMTADYPVPSKLVRFDSGVETFAVTTSTSAGYQGVTVVNGVVFVADYDAGAIQRFSSSGTVVSPFAVYDKPTYIESDSSGNVYMTNFNSGPTIATRFNSAGAITQTFAGTGDFEGIDADAAGNVYTVGFGGTLAKYSPAGTLLASVSAPFASSDLAIDESGNRLFLASKLNVGAGIRTYDISGAAPVFAGSIATPTGRIIVGVHFAAESGNVFATDTLGFGYEYSPGGSLVRQYHPAGATLASDIATLPVPEPSAAIMLLIATGEMMWLGLRRRRAS
jgi:hypothetical protein